MCNDFGLVHALHDIERAFLEGGVMLDFPQGRPNLEPRDDIWPTDPAAVVRLAANGAAEWAQLKWGFQAQRRNMPSGGPRSTASRGAPPVINFRSEGRAFTSGRCLIPASHFFEFTGAKSPKSKWKFTRPDGALFCIGGLWRGGDPDWGPSFTMLTVEPGPDVAPIHNRQIVILEPQHWAGWLDPALPAERFLRPCQAGALTVERVR